ncbi:thioredoxin domain-containing protein [Siminovitchia sp. 179-K 8D1 HS]|uniref:thioredoxin domain-containing protein n=1 Tax=Siminovitchia sp. 179-K 8D1 HS TaxID=3142385 RepID=UPI00399EFC0F
MKLIKFELPGCNPCQMVQNFLDSKEVRVEKINPMDQPETAAKFDIASVPVTILLNEEGSEVDRCVGFNPEKLDELISKL